MSKLSELKRQREEIELGIVKETLKEKNFFEEESKKILEETEDLLSIIITIEKNYNITQVDFRYNEAKRKFVRLNHFEDGPDALDRYASQFIGCDKCTTHCFKTEMSIDDFLALVTRGVYEPVAVRKAE